MWSQWKFLCLLFLICSIIVWLVPAAESLELRRSALKVLESNINVFAYPSRDEPQTGNDATSPGAPPTAKSAVALRAAGKTKRAALLRKRVTPYQSRIIAAKQGFLCAICGKPFSETDLWDIDHKTPLHLCRGTREQCNALSNLRAIHRTCHVQVTSQQFSSA